MLSIIKTFLSSPFNNRHNLGTGISKRNYKPSSCFKLVKQSIRDFRDSSSDDNTVKWSILWLSLISIAIKKISRIFKEGQYSLGFYKELSVALNGINLCSHLGKNRSLIARTGSNFQNFISFLHSQ